MLIFTPTEAADIIVEWFHSHGEGTLDPWITYQHPHHEIIHALCGVPLVLKALWGEQGVNQLERFHVYSEGATPLSKERFFELLFDMGTRESIMLQRRRPNGFTVSNYIHNLMIKDGKELESVLRFMEPKFMDAVDFLAQGILIDGYDTGEEIRARLDHLMFKGCRKV